MPELMGKNWRRFPVEGMAGWKHCSELHSVTVDVRGINKPALLNIAQIDPELKRDSKKTIVLWQTSLVEAAGSRHGMAEKTKVKTPNNFAFIRQIRGFEL